MITIRLRRRFASRAGVLLSVGLVPFLVGSVTPNASVTLAAGPPGPAPANPTAQSYLGGGRPVSDDGPASRSPLGDALASLSDAQDLFLFPGLQLPAQPIGNTLASVDGLPGFIWPVHGPIASRFGPRIHPVLGRPMFHTGLDIMAACGTPIRAAADGQVVYAAITPSWGRRVIIRHTSSLETGYAHMSRFLVASGATVKQGDIIGLVGTTGWSTGCHLHFDVIVNGQYTDPAPYLGLPGSSAARIPYHQTPYLALGQSGTGLQPVDDGDVPVPPDPALTTSEPTSSPTTSQPPTTTTTTSEPPTTTTTTTTTTSQPPTTTTTSEPPTSTTTTSTTSTTTTSEPPTSTTTTTSEPAASTTTTTSTTTTSTTSEPITSTTDAVTTTAETTTPMTSTSTVADTGTASPSDSTTTVP